MRPRLGQRASALPRCQHLRENGTQFDACQSLKLLHHALVVVQLFAVDGEHSAGLAHAHDLLSGQLPVDVACKCGQVRDIFDMLFVVENGLIQVSNAPALWDVKAEQICQFSGCLAGNGIAPGTKLCQLFSFLIKGKVAVHHGRDAYSADRCKIDIKLCLHIGLQIGKAGLQSVLDHIHRVCPYTVYELILPLEVPRGDRNMLFIDEHGLDACRAQFDSQYGFCKVHHFSFHIRSFTISSSSSFSGVVSFVMCTNSMSIIRAQSRSIPGVTS